jgi:hypothetical protein
MNKHSAIKCWVTLVAGIALSMGLAPAANADIGGAAPIMLAAIIIWQLFLGILLLIPSRMAGRRKAVAASYFLVVFVSCLINLAVPIDSIWDLGLAFAVPPLGAGLIFIYDRASF